MRILVTGGSGFIGSNFIRYILGKYKEYEIVNLDLLTYAGNPSNLMEVQSNPKYYFVHGDICDRNLVSKVTENVDWVVHFAAESHVDRSIQDSSPFVRTNVLGTQVLLDCSLKNKVKRFHHVSTDEVFGSLDLGSKEKFNENTSYNPRNPYSASKAGSDFLVRSYFHTFGLPITITNTSNNFGPYQFPEKLIPLAITNLLEGKNVPVYGDGKNVRDWIYVEDHVRAIDMVLQSGVVGETYCVGGQKEKEYSNLDVVNLIIDVLSLGRNRITFVEDRSGHDRRYAVDYSKISHQLGWKPEHDFGEWMEKTSIWYKDNISWWKNIKSGEYKK